MQARSRNKWNQIHLYLENMPEKMTLSYKQKLNEIKNKMQSLEETWMIINKKWGQHTLNKKNPASKYKIFRKKQKILQLEYVSHLKSLSIIFITIQNIHY